MIVFTLRQLEIFNALADSTRVIDVSEKLGMTQSAVSMAIRELEKELKEPLFERIGKRLVLNERGRLFHEASLKPVRELRSLYESFINDAFAGHLKLAASVTISNYLLPSLIGEYRSEKEKVKISLKTENSTEVIAMVREGGCDLGFIEGRFEESDLESASLMVDELVVVSGDPELGRRSFFIDELSALPWILRESGSGTREIFLSSIAPIDKELSIDMEFEQNEAIKRYLIQNKQALSCLPRISLGDELEQKKLFEVEIKRYRFTREFRMIWRKEKPMSTLSADFKRYVSEYRLN